MSRPAIREHMGPQPSPGQVETLHEDAVWDMPLHHLETHDPHQDAALRGGNEAKFPVHFGHGERDLLDALCRRFVPARQCRGRDVDVYAGVSIGARFSITRSRRERMAEGSVGSRAARRRSIGPGRIQGSGRIGHGSRAD